jgi:hypothetical protein
MEIPVRKFLAKILEISREYGAPQPKLKLKVPLASIKESLAKKEQSIEPISGVVAMDIDVPAKSKPAKSQFKTPRALTPVRAPSPVILRPPHLEKCFRYLRKLMSQKNSHWFLLPVDPIRWNLPTYFDVIKNPMDFSTIQKKIDEEVYQTEEEFIQDVQLVFQNSMAFNPRISQPHIDAQLLLQKFEREFLGIKHAVEKLQPVDASIKDITQKIVDKLAISKNSNIFMTPVDPSFYPDYHTVVKNPIDLLTISNKIANGSYLSLADFHSDLELMFANCFAYNKKGTYGYITGIDLQHYYMKLMKPYQKLLKSEKVFFIECSNPSLLLHLNL